MSTNPTLKFALRIASARLVSAISKTHVTLYRRTKGRIGHRIPGSTACLLLEHTGAKSGVKRITPLNYFRHGDDLIVVASLGGGPKNPAWYYNLRANPDAVVWVGKEKRLVRAHVADAQERSLLWTEAVKSFPPYAQYQQRADQIPRSIPVVALQRTELLP